VKKILLFIFITAAGCLYAEISAGGIADMVITPFQLILNEDNTPARRGAPELEEMVMGAGAGRYASGQGPRARLDFKASLNDVIGMRARIQARTDGIGIEDYLQAWWKPLPWLRVDAGRFFDDKLRGRINDLDERMNAYTVRMYDGDAIFSRFRTHWTGQAGIMLSFTPLENLYFGALLYGLNPFNTSAGAGTVFDAHPDYIADNADVWKRIQAAAAWNFPNIGLLRFQYFGAKPLVDIKVITDETAVLPATYRVELFTITAPRFEAAFAFTGLKGLILDIGGKLPFPFKEWINSRSNIFEKEDESLLDPLYKAYKNGYIWQTPYQASLGFKYSPETAKIAAFVPIEISGRIDAKFLGSIKSHNAERYLPAELNIHIWPSYNFNFAKVILDFGFEYIGPTYDKHKELIGKGGSRALNGGSRTGFGISVQKSFTANSFVKGGVAYKFAGEMNGVMEKAVLSVPLFLEFWF